MSTPPSVDAARRFIAFALNDKAPSLATLAEEVDRLVLAYWDTPEGVRASYDASLDLPDSGYTELRQLLGQRFRLGYYAETDTQELSDPAFLVGDAIDDLADIVIDLRGVVWHFETWGANEANHFFREMFAGHWGRHARGLALHLYELLFLPREDEPGEG